MPAFRGRWGCTVLAIDRRDGNPPDTHPDADILLSAGDVLVVIGSISEVTAMRDHFRAR